MSRVWNDSQAIYGMKQFLRITLNGLTILSAMLMLVFIAMCVRSLWRCDEVNFTTPNHHNYGFYSESSYMGVWTIPGVPDQPGWVWTKHAPALPSIIEYADKEYANFRFVRLPGICGVRRPSTYGDNVEHLLFVHFLYPVILLALLPLNWMRKYRGNRWRLKASMGCCQNCGYDLRATPERCPECGTFATKKVPADDLLHNR